MTYALHTSDDRSLTSLRRDLAASIDRLRRQHQTCEQQLHELGRCDAIRAVTGRSAIERAIASGEQMLDHVDRMLDQPVLIGT
ncbi:MAG: hypothetical protein AAF432_12065 [Planctomycetota bacterium]